MKEKIVDFTFCLLSMGAILFIFRENAEVRDVILKAIDLFFKKVFVSLFPMFIINDILMMANFPFYFYQVFNNIFKKVFRASGILAYVFLLSLLSGTPSNAYILKNLVKDNKISVEEANHYLYFTYFSNPLFLYTMLKVLFSISTTIKIILIHYFSNIIIGIIKRRDAPIITNREIKRDKHSISREIPKSISKSINTLLMILGVIVFYMLIIYIINNLFNFTGVFKVISAGFLEITNGLNTMSTIKIYGKLKEIIAISIISFGGLSIHTQIKGILDDSDINYQGFFKGRIMQVIISVILVLVI